MNELIILINQTGNYKGGAQKRYLNLFNYLTKKHSNLYLLLNDSLYESCKRDNIIDDYTNVIHVPVMFEKRNITVKKDYVKSNVDTEKGSHRQGKKLFSKTKYFFACLISVIRYSIKLARIIYKYRINKAYCIYKGGMWSWPLLKLIGIPYVYSYNDTNFSHVSTQFLDIWSSEVKSIKNAKIVDCLSPYIADNLKIRFKHKDLNHYNVTPNSFIDYDIYKPSSKKEKLIVFCSRLEPLKNPMLFIKSIDKIKNLLNGYKVVIIGDGPSYINIDNYVNEHNLEDIVSLTGALSSSYEYIKKSQIFISIQENNNYPSQSLLEAMACENAIIASDVGETRLLVTENEGILVDLSINSLSKAILCLVNDSSLIDKLGKHANQVARSKHTIENFSKYFMSIMGGLDE